MKFYNNIPVEKIDISGKLAYCYWYEHMKAKGYKLTSKQTVMYEQWHHEVMDYGFSFFEEQVK